MKRCNGLILSPPDAAPYGFAKAPVSSPLSANELSRWVRRGGSQFAEDCVAWSYAGAIWATLGLLGLPKTWPSVLALYYIARLKAVKGKKSMIADTGSSMLAMSEIVRETGWISEAQWRYDRSAVNKEPPWGALIAGLDQDWLRPKRIPFGARIVDQIKAALSAPGKQARSVIRGKRVDQSYLDWEPDGSPPWILTGPVVGRHAELCASYSPNGLDCVSSWGDSDRVESWENVTNDSEAETWVIDVDVSAIVLNLKKMGLMR